MADLSSYKRPGQGGADRDQPRKSRNPPVFLLQVQHREWFNCCDPGGGSAGSAARGWGAAGVGELAFLSATFSGPLEGRGACPGAWPSRRGDTRPASSIAAFTAPFRFSLSLASLSHLLHQPPLAGLLHTRTTRNTCQVKIQRHRPSHTLQKHQYTSNFSIWEFLPEEPAACLAASGLSVPFFLLLLVHSALYNSATYAVRRKNLYKRSAYKTEVITGGNLPRASCGEQLRVAVVWTRCVWNELAPSPPHEGTSPEWVTPRGAISDPIRHHSAVAITPRS